MFDALSLEEAAAQAEKVCAACGAQNRPAARFCRRCGSDRLAPRHLVGLVIRCPTPRPVLQRTAVSL